MSRRSSSSPAFNAGLLLRRRRPPALSRTPAGEPPVCRLSVSTAACLPPVCLYCLLLSAACLSLLPPVCRLSVSTASSCLPPVCLYCLLSAACLSLLPPPVCRLSVSAAACLPPVCLYCLLLSAACLSLLPPVCLLSAGVAPAAAPAAPAAAAPSLPPSVRPSVHPSIRPSLSQISQARLLSRPPLRRTPLSPRRSRLVSSRGSSSSTAGHAGHGTLVPRCLARQQRPTPHYSSAPPARAPDWCRAAALHQIAALRPQDCRL
jgi:hypothetical protein